MVAKKSNYINTELDWAEEQLSTWKLYIDEHPLNTLGDRQKGKSVITIEQQGKFIQETMKNFLSLLEVVNKLREVEDSKKQARGKSSVPPRMQE